MILFCGDLCEMHEKMLKKQTSGVFNAGTERISFSAIATQSLRQAEIELIEMPSAIKPQYQKFTRADITALLQHVDIDWTDVQDYIDRLI